MDGCCPQDSIGFYDYGVVGDSVVLHRPTNPGVLSEIVIGTELALSRENFIQLQKADETHTELFEKVVIDESWDSSGHTADTCVVTKAHIESLFEFKKDILSDKNVDTHDSNDEDFQLHDLFDDNLIDIGFVGSSTDKEFCDLNPIDVNIGNCNSDKLSVDLQEELLDVLVNNLVPSKELLNIF